MKFAQALVAGLALVTAAASASAEYPDKPVRIINPFSVGGTGDTIQRLFATKLSERTGKSFIVENKTGASGRIGYEAVAKSPADGYTLVATDVTYTILPGLYGKLPWDPAADLVPVTVLARAPFVFVVNPNARFKTLEELIKYAKANPGKVNFGSAGAGSVNHLVMELFAKEAHISLTHIPYKGMGEALTGLMSNSVDIIATGVPTAINHIKSGKLLALALTAQKRWPATPDVPTLTERGVNVVSYSWMGLMAPKGTPKPVVDYLYGNVVKLIQDPSTKPLLDAQGVEPSGMAPAEFARLLRDDTKRWTEVVRAANITAN
ncbi:tripartite tricarboxylate transporter substrate binding protein [Cupriavidus necator]|uniref:Bug family tripartite tricarboxylate transporter substrate binding protein n=1 Tax=Cupriavidus necator TaxID=106590 RepID=UPI00339D7F3B